MLKFVLVLLAVSVVSAKPEFKDLSDKDHFEGTDGHNDAYDHDAFLGRDEARRFDELSPEDSLKELGNLYGKIDSDGDGFVTMEDMATWIKKVQKRYVTTDAARQWDDFNLKKGSYLAWKQYMDKTYGYENEEDLPTGVDFDYSDMIRRDKRRWKAADLNQDNVLDFEEFVAFLHPEEFDRMHEVIIDETLEDIDKDKDGLVSLDEYIGDMWPDKEEGAEEPDWVKNERESFKQYRDKDKDGFMNREELRAWILPSDYSHIDAEAKHLFSEADDDRDGKLTKEEVMAHHDVFVGSQATDFGEAFTYHDDL